MKNHMNGKETPMENTAQAELIAAVGAKDIDEVYQAMKAPASEWPKHFKLSRGETMKFVWKLTTSKATPQDIVDSMVGDDGKIKIPEEEMRKTVRETLYKKEEGK